MTTRHEVPEPKVYEGKSESGQANGQQEKKVEFPPLIDGNEIREEKIVYPPLIMENRLYLGEKLQLSGGSKGFKTWSLMDMALSVANGAVWWGCKTFATHVVYLNLELPKPFFEKRLCIIAKSKSLAIPKMFHVIHLRGAKLHILARWDAFLRYLESLKSRFDKPLVLIDPIYKMLGGRNENSAGDINSMMDQLEDVVQLLSGSLAYGHHSTKGNQSTKEPIDRSSGSSVFQRDPDTLLFMSQHENDNSFTVNTFARNHEPTDEFVLEWKYPLFVCRGDLDPEDLKKPAGSGSKYSVDDLVKVLGTKCLRTSDFEKLVREEIGMVRSTFFDFLKKAEKAKMIFKSVTANEWQTAAKHTPDSI